MKDQSEAIWRGKQPTSGLCPPCNGNCRQGRKCRADEPPFHWADGFAALIGVVALAATVFGFLP